MNSFQVTSLNLKSYLPAFLPLGLWLMVWLGIGGSNLNGILDPGFTRKFGQSILSLMPLVAGTLALLFILTNLYRRPPTGIPFVSPLVLTAIYGLVGIFASVRSPDGSLSLYWAAAYLSVPLVLWATIWGGDALYKVGFLVNLGWIAIIILVGILFVAAFFYLGLGPILLNPPELFQCKLESTWYDESSGFFKIYRSRPICRHCGSSRLKSVVAKTSPVTVGPDSGDITCDATNQ